MTPDAIYQIDAYRMTPTEAAQKFAAEYWDEPRELHRVWSVGRDTHFSVKDGTRTYKIVYVPLIPYENPECYQIFVVDDGRA
jgi:hypothetical protein